LWNTKFTTSQEALKLQADEYARRLEGLNGEAARIAKSQLEHVPRGEYNIEVGTMKKRLEELIEFKASHEGKASELQMMVTFAVSVLGLIIGCAALWVSFRH
jgi:DNA-binding ferritin-like protein